jgi:eukaryotic-like serine/threonine-protein kinase
MPDDLPPDYPTVSIETATRHDKLCDEFEMAWNDGLKPRIEDWLCRVPDDERAAFICNLAKREQRLRENAAPLDEFRNRFPQFAYWIDTVFRDRTQITGGDDRDRVAPLPVIPGYEILGRIAVGGMGVVYKAMQTGLDRMVALKMVRGGRWGKEEELARFKVEARAVAGLDHPNIVRIYDFDEFEGLPYFTMEYVQGGSLSQKLIAEPMNFRDAAALIETVARTMQFVHDRKLVHRDLKPGNILIASDGTPKISDFGLAKRLGLDMSVTMTGTVMGTASYMAPEQARGDRHISPSVDIYALGAILYECLTGQPPFRDENYERTLRRVIEEEPVRPREIITSVPQELEAICLKCLDKDPPQRYGRAVDLAEDLLHFLNGEPLSVGAFDVIDQHSRWARRLGYDDLELLGCTQWAFVYRARELKINRQVMLKLSTGPLGSPAHDMLHRQAVAMAGLEHPNLERLYSYGEQKDQPHLVLEFVEGRSFSIVMRERAVDSEAASAAIDNEPSAEVSIVRLPARKAFVPVSASLAAEWVMMLARAVQFAHENGVLHCAIYPGEIRLTRDGVPKLCGFGAAQKIDPKVGLREAAATWMRPNYQSPEQVAGDWRSLGPASDVYSLGAVLYEMLTGQAPFFGLSMPETRKAVLEELPQAPRNVNSKVPAFLDWVCQRCLAKKPADRMASAAELADALARYLRELKSSELEEATATFELDQPAAPVLEGDFELRIWHRNQKKPVVFAVPRGRITIGREVKTSDIVVQDEFCSREHCAIDWDDRSNQHVLIVIKAKHGVKINGESVRGSQSLFPGDTIQVASTRIIFERKSQ